MDASQQRKTWMSVLARAAFSDLQTQWVTLDLPLPIFQVIRPAEIGLAQVRARMGGGGRQFNMGDVTLTRAVVKLDSGEMGYSYLQGRNKQHAELAAVIDGLMQTSEYQARLTRELITPLAALKAEQEQLRQQQVASSKVDFFTLVRGED
ncbi:phosphonate C-P lyase system protein PhnG [Photobacterium profundum]|uniref:Putative C-P (Carbon-phosphorous) lyase component n=1 Tax=Photobacterium profundum 3TCK TaxID=314280 RepID=Q1Z605_9GAMM|nr:phosphonate C-P lyase system protein PhnG [Photobacterium profundum]EAS44039.1 putative C-P (carbon-phosphorous) lyase component [Photobacterium profundum 3TCK]PSV61771.1 phosphonate C-P lyase system protein PhnG [Photobacterium profundum]